MPSHFLTAALVGFALVQGAEPNADTPATTEAAPAETPAPPAPTPGDTEALPNIDLPATVFQGEPAPPQTIAEPVKEAAPEAAAEEPMVSEVPATDPPLEELIRPTEKKDRSGKKVAAFWFITTGK